MKISYRENETHGNGHPIVELPSSFCWTKMGGESGEMLDAIIRRKEIERLANGGSFIWGIGSSLGDSIHEISSSRKSVSIVFSRMKSKTKAIDAQPESLILWLGYYEADGTVKELPDFSLVTSRGETEAGSRKSNHYALFCRSASSLSLEVKAKLYADTLVNYSSGKRLGYSQVTAVVKRDKSSSGGEVAYDVSAIAELDCPYFARLACPVAVSPDTIDEANAIAVARDLSQWKRFISRLKTDAIEKSLPASGTTSPLLSTQGSFAF